MEDQAVTLIVVLALFAAFVGYKFVKKRSGDNELGGEGGGSKGKNPESPDPDDPR